MIIDSHCHLTKNFFENPAEIIENAKRAGVEKLICIGTTLADSQEAIDLAQKFDNVFATVGIHPEENCGNWEAFEKLITKPKVVGIGETGLDNKIGKPGQKEVFEKQILLAKKYNKPLVIHVRDAWADIKKINLSGCRGVFHCYSGPAEIPNNFYVSFAGNVTFRNAKELQSLAKNIPLEKILLETDSPFLAPDPLRGSKNEPKNVKIIAEYLAKLKNISFEEISKITSNNTLKLFNL